MKRWFGKKQVVLAALILALGAAVYLNYSLAGSGLTVETNGNNPNGTISSTTGGNLGDSQLVGNGVTDYFEAARSSREQAREESLEILEEVLGDKSTAKETAEETAAKVSAIALAVTQEDKIESLVKAKGFGDCVAYIEGEHCSVVVQSEALSESQTVQILEIVTAQSSVEAKNVTISAVKS